ncbi:hypothetical protein [Mangrovibacterium sp.]|uniref:hypothetical protein n=1 Tax=Mangrovibacterium sp. TaxID=1961364 RepID=UPI00356696A5
MDKTFTWLEFLLKSEDDLFESELNYATEKDTEFTDLVNEPKRSSLNAIWQFAEIYDTLKTKSIGYIELNLN